MTMDPDASGPYAPQTPPKSGSKVWVFLGIGCGLMLLLCCGGGVAMFYGAKSAFQVANEPAAVQQQSSQIADFDVPNGFQADTAVTVSVPFTGQKVMTMVVYTPPDKDGSILLTGIGTIGANTDREQMRAQIEQQMSQQGQQKKRLDVLESHDLKVEIRGKPATFKIQQAEDPQTKRKYIQIDGLFEGKEGPAFLIGQLKADDFSEEDAEKLVRSIK